MNSSSITKVRRGFNNTMINVSEELLSLGPVYRRPLFISSVSMQSRKKLIAYDKSAPNSSCGYPWLEMEEEWNYFNINFGPYENKLINEFIKSKNDFIPFRGGSRSGKTSTLRYIKNKIDEQNNSTTENATGNHEDNLKRKIKIIYVDHSGYEHDMKEGKKYSYPPEYEKISLSNFFPPS